jgi:hypothetical protein
MRWRALMSRLVRHRSPYYQAPTTDRRPSSDGWVEMPMLPELFSTWSDTLDTICPTPWNMLGLMIGNQFLSQEEKDENESDEHRAVVALH